MKDDKKYLLSFVATISTGLAPLLISTFLMLYISHYVTTGVLKDDKEAKSLYSRVSAVGFIVSALFLPIMGKIADQISIKSLFPAVFIARTLFCFALRFVEDPLQIYCQVSIGGVFIMTVIQ